MKEDLRAKSLLLSGHRSYKGSFCWLYAHKSYVGSGMGQLSGVGTFVDSHV